MAASGFVLHEIPAILAHLRGIEREIVFRVELAPADRLNLRLLELLIRKKAGQREQGRIAWRSLGRRGESVDAKGHEADGACAQEVEVWMQHGESSLWAGN